MPIYIPGPNNELVRAEPPDTSSRFPIIASYAESSSYSETASYALNGGGGGIIISGSGSVIIAGDYVVTSSTALNNRTASYAQSALTASYARTSLTSSYSETASFVQSAQSSLTSTNSTSASYSVSASYAQNSGTASYVQIAQSSITSTSASYSTTASYAQTSGTTVTASYARTASYVSVALSATTSTSASYSLSSSFATSATTSTTASYALTASFIQQSVSASYSTTASYVQSVVSASYAVTASYVSGSSTTSVTSSYALTASYVQNAISASYAQTSGTSVSASYAPAATTSSYALTASYVQNVISASYSVTASYVPLLSTQTDLASGTALSINTNYYVTLSNSRTLTFSGASASGDWIDLKITSTNTSSLTFPQSVRLGTSGTTTVLNLSSGSVYELTWQYVDSKWWLADSVNDSTASLAATASYAITASYALNGGGAGSTASAEVSVNQSSHGFITGSVIRPSGSSNFYVLAKADSSENAEVVGIVTTVVGSNDFKYTTEGIINVGMPTASAGSTLFLSPSVAGGLTSTEPTASGNISKPLVVVVASGTRGIFTNMRGSYVSEATGSTTGTGSLVFSDGPTLTNVSVTGGSVVNCTVDGTNLIGYRGAPQNLQTASYTLVLSDAGKSIYHPASDNSVRTFTIDSNANVPYPRGTIVEFINMAPSSSIIAITSDVLILLPAGTTGSRTLARYGRASVEKIDSGSWIISGNSSLT